MRLLGTIVAAVLGLGLMAGAAQAQVVVRVNMSSQSMNVIVDGQNRHTWAISSGRMGYGTPRGTYRPQRMERMWHSRRYGMAPMPYSIFFRGGYAIHGTTRVGRLGRTDSHGCIRLLTANARTLFQLVQSRRGDTRIVIEGTPQHDQIARRGADRIRTARVSTRTRVAAAPARTAQMQRAIPRRAVVTPAPVFRAVPLQQQDWFLRR